MTGVRAPAATSVRVAICTNRTPAAIAPCLEELALQGGGGGVMIVCSGLGDPQVEAHQRAAQAALPGALVLSEPETGLSRARNRALAECADEDVIAFLDDDALVGQGWLGRLRAAWDAADARVACIGGPIRPRFTGVRPGWLTDALLPALTVLDYGSAPLDLDPNVRSVYGANCSFRAGPLRAIGGFDPRYGHSGTGLWFSEEDEAQRALFRAGYKVRYAPDAWVWHVIPPDRLSRRAVLERRFRYGATLGARKGRSRVTALVQTVRSSIGLAVALAKRDDNLVMERAYRAVENAGVLAGQRVRPRA
jgi:GT2 family glycosyltransferase